MRVSAAPWRASTGDGAGRASFEGRVAATSG